MMLFQCLILEFVSLSVEKAKTKLSKLLLMCLKLPTTLLWYAKEEKYLYETSVCFHNFFSQTYLIWAPKLDVGKIGIPLSKRT